MSKNQHNLYACFSKCFLLTDIFGNVPQFSNLGDFPETY